MDGISLFHTFVSIHRPQLISSGIPQHFWEILYKKLKNQIFDAGEAFSLLLVDYDGEEREYEDPVWAVQVSKPGGINVNDPTQIYLIDHAWTFRIDSCSQQLREHLALLDRMCMLMGIDTEDSVDCKIENVCKTMWKYCQTYAIGGEETSVEERMPVWYIMDELGSGIPHNDDPNFRTVPFVYVPEQITYSLLFPVKYAPEGSQVTRDFVEGTTKESLERKALLLPWQKWDFFEESSVQTEPEDSYFLGGRIEETLPAENITDPEITLPLKVYSDYNLINQHLTNEKFQIVDDENIADILWYTRHFKGFAELSANAPNKFVNQFPFENVITIKDLLSVVSRRNFKSETNDLLETLPNWLPTTFNLKTELVKFVAYFQNRHIRGFDNHWICKPFNLARGLDTHVTNNLFQILRLIATGPKVAQKYIEKPVLFSRPEVEGPVKFDIRYVILLRATHPLDVYIYKNFFLRFANKPFALNKFDDYEQHFTVMNYNENATLCRMLCAEFKEEWQRQYPDVNYEDLEKDIIKMLKEMFEGAIAKEPPCGIGRSPQSRALYAADIMLKWNGDKMIPQLLEVNWTPDCKRACDYYPEFYNDIFKLLFLNDVNTDVFIKL